MNPTVHEQSLEALAERLTEPLIFSCGCWWQGDERIFTCPAHNR
ncbi:hypothetical protein [Planobispora rosea]|nr:hypothetical protein [Planobispora rosea]